MAQSLPIHHFYHLLIKVNVIRQMAPLFSKVDSNKLWHEANVIYAQFGKDLFNISKVIGRKKVAQFFWLTVYNLFFCSMHDGQSDHLVRIKSSSEFYQWTNKNAINEVAARALSLIGI